MIDTTGFTYREEQEAVRLMRSWRADWNKFAYEVLGARLDKEQRKIVRSVQHEPRTSVASGTARGKDFLSAVAGMCFMYLTPEWDHEGELIANTKVAMTAPTGRQVGNIMVPEYRRLYNRAIGRGVDLPGRLVGNDIRTDFDEWFLTGFKADEHTHEAWSGFHAVNTMFIVTEASGIADGTFNAIEGNLQGNSRILIVFNPNQTTGYAAKSQRSEKWSKFRLSSLTAPNVVEKKVIIPGQVDFRWVKDRIDEWCTPIEKAEVKPEEDDFEFDGAWYRPSDLARVKILGKFPKVGIDSLIPQQWVEAAQARWVAYHKTKRPEMYPAPLRLGVDVAGMGKDNSVLCPRHGNIVRSFDKTNSAGRADHMRDAGNVVVFLRNNPQGLAFIDTIGEGAGVYSRMVEQKYDKRVFSVKYSEAARDPVTDKELTDMTGERRFANMRAYLFWAVRDWLDPANKQNAMLPPGGTFLEEAIEIKWAYKSNGTIQIENKDDIKARIGYSIDEFDALANTFYPYQFRAAKNIGGFFR